MKNNDSLNRSIRLLAVGDVMLGDTPVCFGHGVRSTVEKHGLGYIFEASRKHLSKGDVLFGNLETVLVDDNEGANLYGMEMKGKSSYANDLADVGFNVMSVANNHAMQHGADAFNETVVALQNQGIKPIGVKEGVGSNCSYYEKDSIRLAFIGYSLRPEKYEKNKVLYAQGDEAQMLAHINNLKIEGVHVILSVHWGEEYLHYPSLKQVCFAKKIIDAGACLVLGHHPHVLQGIEKYKHGVIAYSLGNFIFDSWQRRNRETMIFDCTFGIDGIETYDYVPVYINSKFQPIILTGAKAEKIRLKIQDYSKGLLSLNKETESDTSADKYKQLANKAYAKHRMKCYIYFALNIYKYKPKIILDSLIRFVRRRINPSHV